MLVHLNLCCFHFLFQINIYRLYFHQYFIYNSSLVSIKLKNFHCQVITFVNKLDFKNNIIHYLLVFNLLDLIFDNLKNFNLILYFSSVIQQLQFQILDYYFNLFLNYFLNHNILNYFLNYLHYFLKVHKTQKSQHHLLQVYYSKKMV